MVNIVSFDFFAPLEYVDVEFTEVWAWSPHFEWIGYDSVNFIVALGSIVLFYLLLIFLIVLVLLKVSLGLKCPCKWAEALLSADQ